MTQQQFNQLPPLLTRSQAVECGVSEKVIDDISIVLKDDAPPVPFGKIGAVPIGAGRKKLYRKCDVAKMNGFNI